MPTGYTAELYEGEQSFEDFVLTCARSRGALVLMRDEPMDAEIPDEFPESSFYKDSLDAALKELDRLKKMTEPQKVEESRATFKKYVIDQSNEALRREALRSRYQAMIDRVEEWTPPTDDHQSLKDFMIQQLEESIRFDCGDTSGYFRSPPQDPGEWWEGQVRKITRDISRYTEEWEKEKERARGRTEYVQQLKRSLGLDVQSSR